MKRGARALVMCQLDPLVERRLAETGRAILGRTAEECVADGSAGGIEAVVVRSGTKIDRAWLDLFPGLRLVVRAGSGVDAIDVAELERRGIHLARNPEVSAPAVAELALGALLLLARRVPEAEALLVAERWAKRSLVGDDVASLKVGIWGAGPVGRRCAAAVAPFAGDVVFAGWRSLPPELTHEAPDALLATADVHVLCLPLRAETRGAWGAERLAAVAHKRPYLINMARHELLDLEVAVDAVAAGRLRGLFVDPINEQDLPLAAALKRRAGPANLLFSQHLGAQRRDIHREIGRWVLATLGMDDPA